MTPRLLAFDWFNTLGNVRDYCTRDELRSYAEQIERNKTDWQAFELPERWAQMPVFDDAVEGIKWIRNAEIKVAIFSNAPVSLAFDMLAHNGIEVDGIVPLECYECSKPTPAAYHSLWHWAFHRYGIGEEEIAVITANEKFGDIEGAKAAGMQSYLIRDEELPTLFDLLGVLVEGD